MPEPELLFSPIPDAREAYDTMTAERRADSVLFKVDAVAANAPPTSTRAHPHEQSSGLVDVRDLFPIAPAVRAPTAAPRASSGLVALTSAEPELRHASIFGGINPAPQLSAPPSVVTPQLPRRPRPTVPTAALMVVVLVLFGAVLALMWKILASG